MSDPGEIPTDQPALLASGDERWMLHHLGYLPLCRHHQFFSKTESHVPGSFYSHGVPGPWYQALKLSIKACSDRDFCLLTFWCSSLMSSQYDKPRQASAPSYIRGFPRRPGGQGWCCAPFTECFEGQNVLFIVSLAPQCRRNPASGTSNVVPLRPLTRSLDSPAFPVGSSGRLDWRFSWWSDSVRHRHISPYGPSGDPASYSFQGRKSGLSLLCLVRALCIHYSTHRVSECLNSSLSAWKTAEGERCLQTGNLSLDYGYEFPWLIRPEAKLAHWESGHSTISASVSQFILDSGWLVRYRACI